MKVVELSTGEIVNLENFSKLDPPKKGGSANLFIAGAERISLKPEDVAKIKAMILAPAQPA